MTNIYEYSGNEASNNQSAPDGAPEGAFTGADINDTIRELMASVYRQYAGDPNASPTPTDPQYITITRDLTPRGKKTVTYISDTVFRIAGCDATAFYTAGRRVQFMVSNAKDNIGYVVSSIFSAGATDVTVSDVSTRAGVPSTVPNPIDDDGAWLFMASDIPASTWLGATLVGSVTLFSGAATLLPAGWLVCDGDTHLVDDFPVLAGIYGSDKTGQDKGTYDLHPTLGTAGIDNFRVPDMRGAVPLGQYPGGDGDTPSDYGDLGYEKYETDPIGAPGVFDGRRFYGEKRHALLIDELPAHDHDDPDNVTGFGTVDIADQGAGDPLPQVGEHGHKVDMDDNQYEGSVPAPGSVFAGQVTPGEYPATEVTSDAPEFSAHNHAIKSQGSDTAHETRQPSIVMVYAVYAGA